MKHHTRRALIQYCLASGAALGLARSRICEVLEDIAGPSVAAAAGAAPTKRSVHIRAGNGGFAWFQLLWPHNAIAAAGSTTFAWHQPGQQKVIAGTGGPLTLAANTPFYNAPAERQITAFMAGSNEAHTNNPTSIARALNGSSMFAVAAAIQSVNPTVVPVITVDDVAYGSAPGAPRPSVVPGARDIVGLFNSAASRAGGLLADRSRADLYVGHYAALAALNRAANRSTTIGTYTTGRSAAGFLGTNLADKLSSTPTEEAAYGIDAGTPPQIAEMARVLMTTAKAFQLGLTSCVVLPGPRDDPHTAFDDPARPAATAEYIRKALDGFMADLQAKNDPLTMAPLADDIVITIEGDTPKTPLDRSNWGDNPPAQSNWVYVYGGGLLRTGWFGGIAADGTVTGFDERTGKSAPNDGDRQAQAAVAAVAYAIARGDRRRVGDFTRVDTTGITV